MTLRALLDTLPASLWPPAERADLDVAAATTHESMLETPAALRLMTIVGTWLAAVSFMSCLGILLEDVAEEVVMVPLGLTLAVVTGWLRHQPISLGHDARNQALLAVSIAGRMLVVAGLGDNEVVAASTMMLFEAAMLAGWPDPIQRFLSTLGFFLALAFLIAQVDEELAMVLLPTLAFGVAAAALRGTGPAWHHGFGPIVGPVATGAALIALGSVKVRLWADGVDPSMEVTCHVLRVVIAAAIVLDLLRRHDSTPEHHLGAWSGLLVLAALGWWSPGVLVGSALVLLAWEQRRNDLVGLGAGCLVAHGVALYWSFDLTFAVKAATMILPGLALLVGRQVWLSRPTEAT